MIDPILIPTYRTMTWPWTAEMVREYYDMHMNITLRQMVERSGHSLDKLKEILIQK